MKLEPKRLIRRRPAEYVELLIIVIDIMNKILPLLQFFRLNF